MQVQIQQVKPLYVRILGLVLAALILLLQFPLTAHAAQRVGIVDVDYSLNVRSGPGTSYSRIDSLSNGAIVEILGDYTDIFGSAWYEIAYTASGTTKTGYIIAEYVNVTQVQTDGDFEAYLTSQGFPESYKDGLRVLHALYPNWIFAAVHTGLNWNDVVAAESVIGRNLVPSNSPRSWINTADVDSSGRQIARDGSSWVAASSAITAYSLDPRNFLSDPYIFMFETLAYVPNLYTMEGLQNILNGTFMSGGYFNLSGEYYTYAQTFMEAAQQSGVSAYHLAARVRMEQGVTGTVLTAGSVSGYPGYYNFFNVGAVTTSQYSAVVNGARYAATTDPQYLLPWTSPYSAIVGGSIFLGKGYINRGQDTLYFEKFNVTNRSSGLYYHQYMTNVLAPASESGTMKQAYTQEILDGALMFKIPVYLNMPATAVEKPTGSGSGSGSTTAPPILEPVVPPETPQEPEQQLPPSDPTSATITSSVYTVGRDTVITGVTEQTSVTSLLSKLQVSTGTMKVTDPNGTPKDPTAIVSTGDRVCIYSDDGYAAAAYIIVIYGDIDGNGSIGPVDLLRLQKHLLKTTELSSEWLRAADVNRDGKITSLDLLRVQKHLLGSAAIQQSN